MQHSVGMELNPVQAAIMAARKAAELGECPQWSTSWQEVTVAAGVNRWDTVHFADRERQERFQKLMGVKADQVRAPAAAVAPAPAEEPAPVAVFTEEKQREVQEDLEKQFAAGLRRRDGRTVGLGL
eukprot:SM000137S00481  [mRNA]  locus=s137:302578:303647:- [translate_table: standard]